MSKILFVVPPFFGHISPTLSVGTDLISRGHEVIWVGIKDIASEHIPVGGKFIVPHTALEKHKTQIETILQNQDEGPNISGAETIKLSLEETYIPFAKFLKAGLMQLIDELKPDIIINDCIAFAGALCAVKKNIPYITTTPVPPDVMVKTNNSSPKIFEWQQNLLLQLQAYFEIEGDEVLIHSKQMNMVFTSKTFAALQDAPPHYFFVGPVQGRPNNTAFDWDVLSKMCSPKIYVTLGTLLVDIRKEFFVKLIEAFANEPYTIIAATNPNIIEQWPTNFLVQTFVPQTQIMKHVDAVICHGGFNTVNDTFMHGLPMLITPIAYDHFHTASLIEKAGCGISIRYKRLQKLALKNAVKELLENNKYRNNAVHIQQTFMDAGGNKVAVELIENFMEANKTKHMI